MTKRIAFFIVAIALGLAVAADAGQGTGKISGTARDAQNQALPGVKVQLRNIDTGQLVATSRAANDGTFEFTGLNPGNYAVEIVDNSGKIVGVSPSMALAAAGVIAGVGVAASAAGAAAGAVAAGGAGAFFSSAAGILLLVGAGVGTTVAIIALNDEASPSR